MRRFIVILGSAAVAIVAALLLIPALVPASAVKDQLAAYVKQTTGRELAISGDGRLQILPTTGVTFETVQLSGPDGDLRRPFLRAEAVTAEVDLLSLVSGGITFSALTLDTAVIDLRSDAAGNVNWQFGAALKPVAAVHAGPAMAATARVAIRRVSLRNSTIRYHAPNTGAPLGVTEANLNLSMPAPHEAATLTGGFAVRGRLVEVDATLATPQQLELGERAHLSAAVSSAFAQLNFDGHVTPDRALTGALTAGSSQPAALFAAAGANAAPMLRSVEINGQIDAGAEGVRLDDLRMRLDGMTARGRISISMAGARPSLSGQLDFDRLNLDAFRLQPVPQDTASVTRPGLWSAHAAPEDVIQLDLSGLDALDADLTLTAQTLTRKSLTASDAAARAKLQQGTLALDLSRLSLYDGSATGRAELSAHQDVPVISANVEMQQVDALPLLNDASSFDWLSGKLTGSIRLASGGVTLDELRGRLQGEAEMSLRNGALRGLDLPAILARLQSGDISEIRRREGTQTEFVRLNATWTVQDGIASTDDLRLEGPFVNADGEGEVDLRRARLDLKLRPRIAPRGGEGQTTQAVELPLRVQGAWENPAILPDVEAVLRDPQRSLGAAKNFGKAVEQLTDGKVSEDDFRNAIEGLFGKSD